MFCGNSGWGGNSTLWIILLIILLCGCGGWSGSGCCGSNNCGCGSNNNCGNNCSDDCGCC